MRKLTIAIYLIVQAAMLLGGLVLANITYIDHTMGFAANVLAFCLESGAAIWFCITMLQLRRHGREPSEKTTQSTRAE